MTVYLVQTTGDIVNRSTGHVVMSLDPKTWIDTLKFEVKVRNGEIKPKWENGTLIWVPSESLKYCEPKGRL